MSCVGRYTNIIGATLKNDRKSNISKSPRCHPQFGATRQATSISARRNNIRKRKPSNNPSLLISFAAASRNPDLVSNLITHIGALLLSLSEAENTAKRVLVNCTRLYLEKLDLLK